MDLSLGIITIDKIVNVISTSIEMPMHLELFSMSASNTVSNVVILVGSNFRQKFYGRRIHRGCGYEKQREFVTAIFWNWN